MQKLNMIVLLASLTFKSKYKNIQFYPIKRTYRSCVAFSNYLGTASVAAAGVFASLRITGNKLGENKFLFQGAGEVSYWTLLTMDLL